MKQSVYTIQEATLSDAEEITLVNVNSWKTSYIGIIDQDFLDNISYEKRLTFRKEAFESKKDTLHLVAVFNEQVIGFVDAGFARSKLPIHQNANMGEIYAIYFLEQHQRKGLGRELFKRCHHWLSQNGYESFIAWVLAENTSARHFYEREGGKILGEQMHRIGDKDYKECCYLFKISA